MEIQANSNKEYLKEIIDETAEIALNKVWSLLIITIVLLL
jgi:hypothetical protein